MERACHVHPDTQSAETQRLCTVAESMECRTHLDERGTKEGVHHPKVFDGE